jgi:membrane-bound ClpP family serine protease
MDRTSTTLRSWPLLLAALLAQGAQGAAEDAVQPAIAEKPDAAAALAGDLGDGRLIRVRLPLSDTADTDIKFAIERAVNELNRLPKKNGRRPTLVLELSPQQGSTGQGTDFERALSIARYLKSVRVSSVKTVAYVPTTIKGHGVLIALACGDIVMNPEAELGEATIDEDSSRPVEPSILSAYKDMIASKRAIPEAVALGLVDRRLEVLKVETDRGPEFTLRDELDALKKNHTVFKEDVIKPSGGLGSFIGREGSNYGLLLAENKEALARVLALPLADVHDDRTKLGERRPVMLRIEGPINRRKVRQLETLIGIELSKHDVNWIGITIDSAGGDLEECRQLAQKLADLNPKDVQTVAYVPQKASGGAALVALACQQLVMHPEAEIGSRKDESKLDKEELESARLPMRELAKSASRSWSLLMALMDADVELFTYQNTKTGETAYFSNEEAKEQPDAEDWKRGARIKPAGDVLRLSSKQAQEMGVASNVVASFDELKQIYGLDGEIPTAEPNWALELVEALSSPGLAVLLLVVGFVGVYIELHSHGVGAGGFVAAVAFMLFFWSQFLNGTAEWLEVLLFVGGIFFLLVEVLVLPGFGIFGLGGGAMILASLVLATQTFVLPRTESQMAELRHSLTIVAASTLLVVAASIALRRYLPNAPVFRKLLLNPPPEEDLVDLDYRESLANYSHLLGEQGVATTNLMPAGKAEFGGQLVDVIAEGLPIDRGSAIVVVKTRGNRVLVRAVEA